MDTSDIVVHTEVLERSFVDAALSSDARSPKRTRVGLTSITTSTLIYGNRSINWRVQFKGRNFVVKPRAFHFKVDARTIP